MGSETPDTLRALSAGAMLGDELTEGDAERHRGENPDREKTVKQREAAKDVGLWCRCGSTHSGWHARHTRRSPFYPCCACAMRQALGRPQSARVQHARLAPFQCTRRGRRSTR